MISKEQGTEIISLLRDIRRELLKKKVPQVAMPTSADMERLQNYNFQLKKLEQSSL